MLTAISLEHQRDHDDGPAERREGCTGCQLIEFAWQQYERAETLSLTRGHCEGCVVANGWPAERLHECSGVAR
jgi:hypothetical protein